jgi:hypothetical protein
MSKQKGFLHIPKTGGTSVSSNGLWFNLGHCAIIDEPGQCNPLYAHKKGEEKYYETNVRPYYDTEQMFVYVTVRNPYSWLLSWFDFMGGFTDGSDSQRNDELLAREGFDVFVRTILNRDDFWPNRRFLYFQMFTLPSGWLAVDHIFQTEDLDAQIGQELGFRSKPRRDRYGSRHKYGFTTGEYYDRFPGLAEEVFSRYHREFWLLGYDADPHKERNYPEDAILSGNVVDKKGHVGYNLEDDVLNVGRLEFPGKK